MKFPSALLTGSLLFTALSSTGTAAALYSLSTTKATTGLDTTKITVTTATNVTGPTAATLSTGNVGLSTFDNFRYAGFSFTSANGTSIDNATEFGTGYLSLTITANAGYVFNLTSINLDGARGNTDLTRGFEIYTAVNGGAFTFGDVPVLDVANETGTRAAPNPQSGSLAAAGFQGISSITLRYYPVTSGTGSTVEFNNLVLNGSIVAVPEPSSCAIAALAALGLLRRKRR